MSIVSPTTQADRDRGISDCSERIERLFAAVGHEFARLRRLVENKRRAEQQCPCPAGMDGGETCKFCGRKWEL
jgi:hypothetical protein